ncbi:MAG: glutamate ligase domain-containing protein, partial [Flavobacterium sp.]
PVFSSKAKSCFAEMHLASDLISSTYPSDLLGDYQVHNKKTVMQTIAVLNENKVIAVTPKQLQTGMANVIKNTGLQGRWQELKAQPKVIADTAHNKNGLALVMKQIQNEKFDQLHVVLGVVNDKDLAEVLPLFPKNAIYYFCKPNIPRGLEATILQTESRHFNLNGKVYSSVSEAYTTALKNATPTDFVYVGGSTFVVAEIL